MVHTSHPISLPLEMVRKFPDAWYKTLETLLPELNLVVILHGMYLTRMNGTHWNETFQGHWIACGDKRMCPRLLLLTECCPADLTKPAPYMVQVLLDDASTHNRLYRVKTYWNATGILVGYLKLLLYEIYQESIKHHLLKVCSPEPIMEKVTERAPLSLTHR